ncbi:hypothetical protein PIB30_112715, partial [Stylosanthes scabra]|nr:hypothetical protein [Stylosanthes scabra]
MRELDPIIPASAACLLTHAHKPPLSFTHLRDNKFSFILMSCITQHSPSQVPRICVEVLRIC